MTPKKYFLKDLTNFKQHPDRQMPFLIVDLKSFYKFVTLASNSIFFSLKVKRY